MSRKVAIVVALPLEAARPVGRSRL